MSSQGQEEGPSPHNQNSKAGWQVAALCCSLWPVLCGDLSSGWKHNTYIMRVHSWGLGTFLSHGEWWPPHLPTWWKHILACDDKGLDCSPRKPHPTCSSWEIPACDAHPDAFFILLSAPSKPLLILYLVYLCGLDPALKSTFLCQNPCLATWEPRTCSGHCGNEIRLLREQKDQALQKYMPNLPFPTFFLHPLLHRKGDAYLHCKWMGSSFHQWTQLFDRIQHRPQA